jgi:hypothetical protein
MSGKGNSKANTNSTSSTTNSQETTNFVDNSVRTSDENALLALSDVSRAAFDAANEMADSVVGGAYGALTDISSDSLDLGREALGTAERVSTASLDNARLAYGTSLDFAADVAGGAAAGLDAASERVTRFATDALDSYGSLADNAFASNENVTTRALDALTGAAEGVFDFARSLFGDSIAANRDLTDQNVAGLTALATQNSATSEDRISKVVIYAIIGVVVILVAPRIFK